MAVRRVRRIIRRIDPWTVLKVSLVFNAVVALVFVLGSWVTWSMALRRGIPDRVVDIFESLTLTISVEGELYFRIVVLLAIIGAILATAFMTLGAVLYNLISDVVGGVEIAVLEETYRPMATRTRVAPVDRSPPATEAARPRARPAIPETARRPSPDAPSAVPERPLVPAAGVEQPKVADGNVADGDPVDDTVAGRHSQRSRRVGKGEQAERDTAADAGISTVRAG